MKNKTKNPVVRFGVRDFRRIASYTLILARAFMESRKLLIEHNIRVDDAWVYDMVKSLTMVELFKKMKNKTLARVHLRKWTRNSGLE